MVHDRFSYRGGTAPSDCEPDLQLVPTHLSTKEDETVRWDLNSHTHRLTNFSILCVDQPGNAVQYSVKAWAWSGRALFALCTFECSLHILSMRAKQTLQLY